MLQQRVAWQQHTMCWLLGHVWPLVCNGCTTTVTTTAACQVEHAMPDRANAFVAASAVQHPHIQVCKQAAQHTQLHSCTAASLPDRACTASRPASSTSAAFGDSMVASKVKLQQQLPARGTGACGHVQDIAVASNISMRFGRWVYEALTTITAQQHICCMHGQEQLAQCVMCCAAAAAIRSCSPRDLQLPQHRLCCAVLCCSCGLPAAYS
jgi:hypothetical protein